MGMKFKVFISQPMRGYTEEQILENRDSAFNFAKEKLQKDFPDCEVELVNSFIEEAAPEKDHSELEKNMVNIGIYYLAKSLSILSQCNVAVFAKGSQLARGCIIERTVAESYGIPVIDEE